MKHAKPTRAWRPVRAYRTRRAPEPQGVWSALVFNVCLFLLPLAAAAAVIVVARDHLFAYEYSESGARSISQRVEKLNGELIQVDFDRQRQWDNMVAMELMADDPSAARGFLLSGTEMLPPRMANILRRAASEGAGDAAIEVAAMQLLLPGTRERYQATVPLLSLRPANATPTATEQPATAGDPRDFETMARSLLTEPDADPLQFVLSGFSLGLAGDMSSRMQDGAATLLAAYRRDDFPTDLATEIRTLAANAVPIETFRTAAQVSAEGGGEPGSFDNASVAFAASIDQQAAAQLHAVISDVGDMSAATSKLAAETMLTHANTVLDFPRLRLLAQTAGDRAAAAAKRLPRDGRLLLAARGDLTFNRDLTIAAGAIGLALLGLVLVVLFNVFQALRGAWKRASDGEDIDDYEEDSELLEISTNNWRPL